MGFRKSTDNEKKSSQVGVSTNKNEMLHILLVLITSRSIFLRGSPNFEELELGLFFFKYFHCKQMKAAALTINDLITL